MTAKNGGSGFDADKFRKLVAMFDSDYTEEAVTAFRLAVAELKKKQLRFCDRLVDSSEARELAEIECAKVRDELTRVLDQCARHEADIDDAHETIDRLHERIAAMEKRAGARAKKYGRKESAEDLETVAPPDETDLGASEDWDNAPPPPMTPSPHETPGHEHYRLPALPVWKSAYWLGLLSFVFLYACAVAGQGHLLTIAEWQAENLITDGALLFAMVASLYVAGGQCGFSQTRVGQWCIRNAGSVGDMLLGLVVVIVLGFLAYAYFLAVNKQIDAIGLSLFGIVGIFLAALGWQYLLQTFGWAGVGIKLLMWFDFWCITLCLALNDIPGWKELQHHPPMTHAHLRNAIYFAIAWGLFAIPDTPTHWAIRYKKVRQIVTLPALFFVSFYSVVIADYAIEGRKPQPAVTKQSQPEHGQASPRKPKYPSLRIVPIPAQPKRGSLVVVPPHSPVLLATALLTPQPYRYQPYRYQPYREQESNAEIVRGWCRDLKSFFDELLGKEIEGWIVGLIALRWLWKASQRAKDRRIKRKAIERALNPPMPRNIHGDAGFVEQSRAKKQGWI